MQKEGNNLKATDMRLRAVEPSDSKLLYDIEKEGFDDEYGDVVAPLSLEMLRTYALTYDADPFSAGALRLIAEVNDEIVGVVDLYDISAMHQRAEVGIYICKKQRGRGCGKRVLDALHQYCKNKLNLVNLLARTFAGNEIANRLFAGSGYILRGVLVDWEKRGNVMKSVNLYQKRMESC